MTYTLPTPAGKIFYPAEGDNEGDDAFDAEQVRAAYDKGLEDTVIALTKLLADLDLTQLVNDQHAETILWQAGRISEMIGERDVLGAELESALKDRVALAMQVDALRAELAKMREQGPVAWLKPCAELEVCEPHEDCSFPVYAAPGAQP